MINHDKKTTGFGGNPQRKRDGTPVQLRSRAGSTTRREVVASELRRTSTSGCRWRADWALPASSYRTMGFFIVKHLAIKGQPVMTSWVSPHEQKLSSESAGFPNPILSLHLMVLSHIATISTQVFSTKLQQRVVGCLGNSLGLEPMIYGGWSMVRFRKGMDRNGGCWDDYYIINAYYGSFPHSLRSAPVRKEFGLVKNLPKLKKKPCSNTHKNIFVVDHSRIQENQIHQRTSIHLY